LIDRPGPRLVLGRSLAFAALAVALVALRILERGESFQPRTLLLLAMVAGGALASGTAVFAAVAAVAKNWPAPVRAAVVAPLLGGGFAACAVLIFSLLRPITESDFDHEDHHLFDQIGMLIDATALFVVTGGRYWLPWPIVAIGLAGGVLAALPWRRTAGVPRQGRSPQTSPVEAPLSG